MPVEHEQRVRSHLATEDSFLVVAEDHTGLVGTGLGMQALDDDGAGPALPGRCHISMVFVHPGRWGEGLGKQLMRRLLTEGRTRGYSSFQLWTQADNRRSQQLYEGLGFRRCGREKADDLGEHIVQYELRSGGSP